MKVLFVLAEFNRRKWNSVSDQAWNLARRLTADKQIQCVIAAGRNAHEAALEEVCSVPIRRFSPRVSWLDKLSGKGGADLLNGNAELPGLEIYLHKNNFDLVHIMCRGKLADQAAAAARKKNIPYMQTLRSEDLKNTDLSARFRSKSAEFAGKYLKDYRTLLENASMIFCTDRRLYRLLSGSLDARRLKYWQCGVGREFFTANGKVDFRQEFQLPSATPLLLTVGEISESKNQKMLLEVASLLKVRGINCKLVVIGWAADNKVMLDFQQAVVRSKLEQSVVLIPGLPPGDERFRAAYHASSLVLLPAKYDVSAPAVLEAWAAGVPVIASPAGAGGDLIIDNENGRVADPQDFRQWVKCCEELLSERQRATNEKMRSAGRSKALELLWEKRIDELVEIYQISGILNKSGDF